jgi:hypothetical protein
MTKDINQIAAAIVAKTASAKPKKNRAAMALGRLGGLKGGKARAESLSAARRKEIAKKAATSRWAKQS